MLLASNCSISWQPKQSIAMSFEGLSGEASNGMACVR